jgi:hypothetical protein
MLPVMGALALSLVPAAAGVAPSQTKPLGDGEGTRSERGHKREPRLSLGEERAPCAATKKAGSRASPLRLDLSLVSPGCRHHHGIPGITTCRGSIGSRKPENSLIAR